jgi:hypothetical protein
MKGEALSVLSFGWIPKKKSLVKSWGTGRDLIMDALNQSEEEVEAQWEVWEKVKASYPELKFYHCVAIKIFGFWHLMKKRLQAKPG